MVVNAMAMRGRRQENEHCGTIFSPSLYLSRSGVGERRALELRLGIENPTALGPAPAISGLDLTRRQLLKFSPSLLRRGSAALNIAAFPIAVPHQRDSTATKTRRNYGRCIHFRIVSLIFLSFC